MNTLLTAILIVLFAAAIAAGGFLLVSRFVPERWLVADSNAASALYATTGMVYAILIAIAAIAIWEPRTDASANTNAEAENLIEAYWSSTSLAPTDRAEIQSLLSGYLDEAVGPEWTSLAQEHKGTDAAEDRFSALRKAVDSIEPATDREAVAHQQLTGQISAAASARRARIAAADEGMPGMLWPVLMLGGLISVAFLYMFGLARTFPNGLMLGIVGGMVSLLLFVLYQVEFPFSRAFAVGPESMQAALAQIRGT